MRGKESAKRYNQLRITPAYAGKSCSMRYKDHPAYAGKSHLK